MKQIGLIWRERVVESTEVRKQSTRQSFVRAAALEVDGARRMRLLFVCVLLAALLTLLLGTRVIHAAVVERSLEELALSADLILHGTVKTMKSAWNDDKTMIYTKVIVSVTNQIKGQSEAQEVIIQVPGGVVDNMGLAVSGSGGVCRG